jgi:small subunit ribosomal protein S16
MSTRIRLQRAGMKRAPFYRVVVADQRAPRDGAFIELVGRYNPRATPSVVELDVEKVEAWIAKGAQPSEVVVKLLAIAKGEKEAPTGTSKVSKKAEAKAKADADAKEKAAGDAAKEAEAAAEVAEAAVEEAVVEEAVAEVAVEEAAVAEEVAEEAVAEAVVEEAVAEEAAEEAASDDAAE